MITWNDINEKLDQIDLNNDDFDATVCNEIAHDAIMNRERSFVMNLIRSAAESGCFRTILPRCHSDTIKWLEDLDFKVYYQGQTEVSWEDQEYV